MGEELKTRLALHQSHFELGANFFTVRDTERVRFYSDPIREHLAVRESIGVIDLSDFGALRIAGGDAPRFLNGLVTNDVTKLAVGAGMRAAFLTRYGKIVGLCRILNAGPHFLVINEPATHAAIFKHVSLFSNAGDFKVEDVSEEHRLLSLQGPRALLLLKEICFEPVPSLSEHDWFDTLIAGHRATVVKASRTGEEGFDILVPATGLKDVWDFVLLKGRFHSIVPFGLEALDSLRIEAGLPEYGIDVDESNMILEVGLDDAVSFTKGCYTGQEAVSKARYRGHVSKKLTGLSIAGAAVPVPGDVVSKDGKEIGRVTSALRSPSLGSVIALAYLKYGSFDPGSSVEVSSNTGNFAAVVVDLPFWPSPHSQKI